MKIKRERRKKRGKECRRTYIVSEIEATRVGKNIKNDEGKKRCSECW